MKRVLFCAGLLAVMASCTQDEFGPQATSNEAQAPGISFVGTVAEGPATKGEVGETASGSLRFKWYAEQDQINLFANNVIIGGALADGMAGGDEGTTISEWSKYTDNNSNTPESAAQYKATRSENEPYFTGIDKDNVLHWPTGSSSTNYSEFLGIYPTSVGVDLTDEEGKEGTEKLVLSNLPSLANQTQASGTDGNSVSNKALMVAYNTGNQNADAKYESVGETVQLKFRRPMPYLGWKTKSYNNDQVLVDAGEGELSQYLGGLSSIKLEMLGYKANGNYTKPITYNENQGDIEPSVLDYGTDAALWIDMPNKDNKNIDWSKAQFVAKGSDGNYTVDDMEYSSDDNNNTITLSFTDKKWDDKYTGYMLVKPVNRSDFRKKDVNEAMQVTYSFENIDLVVNKDTKGILSVMGEDAPNNFQFKNDWGAEYYTPFTIDIAKFPYLVTKAPNRALIINTAEFDDFYKNGKVEWNGEEVDDADIKTIISKRALSDDELAQLNNFTGVEKIVLIANTEIPVGTFDGDKLTSLTYVNFPAVTTIHSGSFKNFDEESTYGLVTVKMKSYEFDNRDIAFEFLNKKTLVELDMSAATMMNAGFPSQGFLLEGYTKLTTVTIGSVEAGPNAFDGCTSLSTIKPAEGQDQANIKLTNNSFAAFRGTALTQIHLAETSQIPAYAFQNCKSLVYVTSDGTALTSINDYAFQNCEKLKSENPTDGTSIVLDEVQTIGEYAFDGCTAWTKAHLNKTTEIGNYAFRKSGLTGDIYTINGTKRNVLYVGAATVGNFAFEACAFEHIEFLNLTDISNGLLFNCDNLLQIQFNKVFTYGDEISGSSFGNHTNTVILFVNPAQENRNATILNPGKDNAVTFKSILEIENVAE